MSIRRLKLLGANPVELEKKRKDLQDSIMNKSKILSRRKWNLEGEKCTKYFAGLLKDRRVSQDIKSIREEEMTHFWEKVFKKTEVAVNIPKKYFPKIPEQCATLSEQEITEEEIVEATKGASTSPGHDGLVSPLFRIAGMSRILKTVFKNWAQEGIDSESRKKVIRMIPKTPNPQSPDKLRPISLLDVDYKIFTRVLYNRIKNFAPDCVHPDQKGCIKNRFIIENIWQIRFIIEKWKKSKEKNELLLFTDFLKAFDSLQHIFIVELVKVMGFGPNFQKIIQNLYSPSTARIIFNKHLTKEITIEGGVHQGDPLSPIIFVFAIEVLFNMLRDKLSGLKIGTKSKLVMGYVDDTTLGLANAQQLEKALQIFKRFSNSSGLTLNLVKCQIMHSLGESKGKELFGIPIIQDKERITSLGYVFNNQNNIDNLAEKIPKFHLTLKKWKGRHLSLKGKIIALKMSGLSQLWYFSYLSDSQQTIDKINKLIQWFLFSEQDNPETKFAQKASLKTLAAPAKEMGFSLTHVETQILALQMKFWVFYFSSNDPLYEWIGEEIDYIRESQTRRLDVPIYAASKRKIKGNTLLHTLIKQAQKFTWALDWDWKQSTETYLWEEDDFITRIQILDENDNDRTQTKASQAPSEWLLPNTKSLDESTLRTYKWMITLGDKTQDEWTSIKNLTTKNIYNSHVDHLITTTSTKNAITQEFAIQPKTHKRIIKNIKKSNLPPQITSFIYKIYNGILIWWLWRDPKCYHCQQPETWKHVLFECQKANEIRKFLGNQTTIRNQMSCLTNTFKQDWIATYVIWTTYCSNAWNNTEVERSQIQNKYSDLIEISTSRFLEPKYQCSM
jgi:hypothetical protein